MLEAELTKTIIGCAIEVHRWLGPGLLEAVYEEALCYELHARKVAFKRQQRLPIHYKNILLSSELRLDLLVDDQVIVDVKAKESLARTDKPQLLTYLRLCDRRVGLILNFHVAVMKEGVFRVMNRFRPSIPRISERPASSNEHLPPSHLLLLRSLFLRVSVLNLRPPHRTAFLPR